jgi:hypothetical protein
MSVGQDSPGFKSYREGLVTPGSARPGKAFTLQAAFAIAVILLVVAWAGQYVLERFGITPPGLEVAGGVIKGGLIQTELPHKKNGHPDGVAISICMVGRAGFEPATNWLKVDRPISILLI